MVQFLNAMMNHGRSYALYEAYRWVNNICQFEGLITKKPYDIWG